MKRFTLFILIMLTTLGGWAQKSKVLKHTKKSITFVVDENLPKPKQTFSTMSSDQLCTYIIYKKMPSADSQSGEEQFQW